MITAAPSSIGETGSMSTGPMLALNGISRKFPNARPNARMPGGPVPRRASVLRCSQLLQLVQRLLRELLRLGVIPRRMQLLDLHVRHLGVCRGGVVPAGGRLTDLGGEFRALERERRRGQRERYEPNDNGQDETRHCVTSLTSRLGRSQGPARREYTVVCDLTGGRTRQPPPPPRGGRRSAPRDCWRLRRW